MFHSFQKTTISTINGILGEANKYSLHPRELHWLQDTDEDVSNICQIRGSLQFEVQNEQYQKPSPKSTQKSLFREDSHNCGV